MSKIGDMARDIAREKILKQCKSVKLTEKRILTAISNALDAKKTDRADHGQRLDAAKIGIMLYDLKPPEKSKVEHSLDGNLADLMRSHLAGTVDNPVDKSPINRKGEKRQGKA